MPVVRGEVEELLEAVESGGRASIEHEFGDLLFSLANLSRHLGVDAEQALQGANARFDARFRHVEDAVGAAGQRMTEVPPAELEARWQAAKQALGEG
jgi:uncharacterized protein YabN with tetrapyrrole methylase and pyrophosphatase domain